jgi:ubiquinone/menaquinone biosynthesis C-methylase UbiE
MRLAAGFMAAKHLFAASELGIFEALADSPATLDALAARTGLTRRAARISADAMVALGLLDRDGGTYRNGAVAAAFLAGRPSGPGDLRPFLRFWDKISFPTWEGLADALGHGPSKQVFDLDPELQEITSAGIEAILAGPAAAFAARPDLTDRRRLLDIGGGTGSWSIAAVRAHPDLTATVLDLPVTADIARKRVAGSDVADRIDVVSADAMTDPLPDAHDAFLVANVVHYGSPERNTALLHRVRAVADPGARLYLADFWTNPDHTEPLMAALMAGEFAVHLTQGDVYSVDEVREWLTATGWEFVEHAPLAGPQSLIVARVG